MKKDLQRAPLYLAVLAVTAAPAFAQDEFGFDDDSAADLPTPYYANEIEIGVGNTDSGNAKFGEFADDLNESGLFLFGSLDLKLADQADGGAYVSIDKNPYLMDFQVGYRKPGAFKLEVYGSESEKFEYGDAMTLYPSGSSGVFNLPFGYTNKSDLSQYGRRDFSVERSTTGIEIKQRLGDYTLSLDYSRQKKEGVNSIGANMGFAGTAILPSPVDYQHDQLSFGVDYANNGFALGLSYYLSSFDNQEPTLIFDQSIIFGAPSVGVYQQMTLAPSNQFQRLDLDGSYQLAQRTVLSWYLNWSEATQDESFAPNSMGSPFTGADLDGEVERLNGRVTLVSRPTSQLNYKVEYSTKQREANHNPLDSLLYSGGVVTGSSSRVYDKEEQQWSVEAGYRLPDRSRIRVGWEWEDVSRTRNQLEALGAISARVSHHDDTEENRLWASYQTRIGSSLSLTLKVEQNQRDADLSWARFDGLGMPYDNGSGVLRVDGLSSPPVYLLDRDQDVYSLALNYQINEGVALSLSARHRDEDFNNDFDGLQGREVLGYDVGLSVVSSESLSWSLYMGQEWYELDQSGTQSQYGSGVVQGLWETEMEDTTSVWGGNVQWSAVPGKLTLSADLSVSDSESEITTFDRFSATTGWLPDYTTDAARLNVEAQWHYNPQTDFKLRYAYEAWETTDFEWVDGQVISGLGFGYEEPDDHAHAVMLSVVRRF